MHVLHFLSILLWVGVAVLGVLQEEGIMHVSCWVALGLEEGVKVEE